MKTELTLATFMAVSLAFAQESVSEDGNSNLKSMVATEELVTPSQEESNESVKNSNADAEIILEADDKIQEAFDAFMDEKAAAGFSSYGKPHRQSGIIYYAEMEPVNGVGAKDNEFISKRQGAFMRAYEKIRQDFVKYSLNSRIQSTIESEFLRDKSAEGAQEAAQMGQIERLAKKVLALSEAELDKRLEAAGLSASGFATSGAKRKALSQKILAKAAIHAFSSCAGISVVKTIEARGDDDGWSIGVIAKYDPMFVYYADCFAKLTRPEPSKPGIDVGLLVKGDLSQNFGTRFYYDEDGMPGLLTYAQWGVETATDRTERKMYEEAAREEAEGNAITDMNAFIAGSMTFDESIAAGENWSKSIGYDENGLPISSSIDHSIIEYANRKSVSKANLSMGGRDKFPTKIVKHPDTGRRIAIAAVYWSFAKLEGEKRVESIQRNNGRAYAKEKKAEAKADGKEGARKSRAILREGQTFDF